jgi:hypothetical protein
VASPALEEEPDAGLPEGDGEEVAPSEEAVVSVIASPVLESEVELPEEEGDITSVGDLTAVELADKSEPKEAVRPEEEADPLGGREVAAGLGSELRELEGSALAADLDLGVKGFAELLY